MLKRMIYDNLNDWYSDKDRKPLIVLGVRQSGKSSIINKFLNDKVKKCIKIDLFDDGERFNELYNVGRNFNERKEVLKFSYGFDFDDKNSILFIDEIQKCQLFIQDLKLYQEEGYNNIIVSGSLLNIYLRKGNYSFPVGKVKFLYMFPINFEEYLYAIGKERVIPLLKECFINNRPFVLHEELMHDYYRFIINGGMPEMLNNYVQNGQDISKSNYGLLEDIYEGYIKDINKHIEDVKEQLRVKLIYEDIPSQLLKENPKFTYAKLDKNSNKSDYISALDWLITSNMVIRVCQLTAPYYPIAGYKDSDSYKLYLSDVGLLRKHVNIEEIAILMNNDYQFKGILTENYVAQELFNQYKELFYWSRKGNQNNSKAEVDFVIQSKGEVIPIEVKSGKNQTKSLNVYNNMFHPKLMIKIGNYNFGKKDNIKTIPLYATFLIKELIENDL